MNCKVGDKVRFLNDVGGGIVTKIVNKNTVSVLTEEGFEMPAIMSDIIVVDSKTDSNIKRQVPEEKNRPGIQSTTSTKPSASTPTESINSQMHSDLEAIEESVSTYNFAEKGEGLDSEGDLVCILLAFVPEKQDTISESNHNLYVINDSPYRAFYSVSRWEESFLAPIKAGFIEPDTKELVGFFKRNELNDEITLNIQALFFKNIRFVPQQPEFLDLRINPVKFFREGSFVENDFFHEKALVFTIADTKKEALLKTLTAKNIESTIIEKDASPKRVEKTKKPEIEEVDLHIHELVDNPKDFTPGQIIEIQLARFKLTLEGGLKAKTKKMVFIHGVGNGKLKLELRKELEKNYPKIKFQDASFREYGYGATIVYLK